MVVGRGITASYGDAESDDSTMGEIASKTCEVRNCRSAALKRDIAQVQPCTA
jgi:hypothetical protein